MRGFLRTNVWWPIPLLVGWLGIALTAGCNGGNDDFCDPLAPAAFVACADPGACLSMTATWCWGTGNCGNADVDLSLLLPDGVTSVGPGINDVLSAGGCTHGGDEQANDVTPNPDGEIGPYSENITCSPSPQAGRYVIELANKPKPPFLFIVDPGDIRLDINADGVTTCQIVNIDESDRAEIPLDYP
jgi:hypothetical protein